LVNNKPVKVNCKIVKIDGFSSHADHKDLVDFVEKIRENTKRNLKVVLTHYSNPVDLYEDLKSKKIDVHIAKYREKLIIDL
jgi:predicted metal-dependent RNase